MIPCPKRSVAKIPEFLILGFLILFPATTGNAQTWHDRYRQLDVLKYIISLKVSDSSDVVVGQTTIKVLFKEEVTSFVIDLAGQNGGESGMHVDSVLFCNRSAPYTHRNDSLIISAPKLMKGDTGICKIVYHGIPSDGLIISRNMYGDRTFFGDNWPDRAHDWFPCVDHPSDKALVEFRITAPSHYQVIANGRLVEQTCLPDDEMLYVWATGVPLATKVIVTGIARFAVKNYGDTGGIPVSAWVYPQNRDAGFYDFGAVPSILKWYTSLLGPYPFSKLANVQSTTIYGGMENAGNIFYPETAVDGNRGSLLTMVHETAHMWFGNSAGEMDWPDFWLSEGFATYLTDLYILDHWGEEAFKRQLATERDSVISFGKRQATPVVNSLIKNPGDLLNADSYEKGAWILHMIRNETGDSLFMKTLRTYYDRFKFGNATTEDFRKVLSEITGRDFNTFFRQWLYSPGLPVLKFSSKQEDNTFLLTIEQVQDIPVVFEFPLEVQFYFRDGKTERVTFQVNRRNETFRQKFSESPIKIEADPEVRLLFDIK